MDRPPNSSQQPFEVILHTGSPKEKVDFSSLPRISQIIETEKDVSPYKLRQLVEKYNQTGIEIKQIPGFPEGHVNLHTDGSISATIPEISAFGNDGVTVHELVHIEQLLNGLETLTPQEIAQSPDHVKIIAEIGALEIQLKYFDKFLTLREKALPSYQQAIREATEKLEARKTQLGVPVREKDKLNPYKKIVDA